MKNKKILYKKTKTGEISEWSIWSENQHIIIQSKSSLTASPVRWIEEVKEGKQTRSIEEQIISRIESRISSKRDQSMVDSIEEAQKGNLDNVLGLPRPMLATKLKDIKNNLGAGYVQTKLDGHRCLIARVGNEFIAYTRNGKEVTTISHMFEGLNFPEGYVLDGELYCHNVKLQTISSWAKKKQPGTLKLKFHCYDVITPFELPFKERYNILREKIKYNSHIIDMLPTVYEEELNSIIIKNHMKNSRQQNYEGLILRPENGIYSIGRRSKELIKVKEWLDDEFKVKDVSKSKAGFAILHFELNGEEFKSIAPGTHIEKMDVLNNPNKYIGRQVTIEYAFLTNRQVPFQPIATRWKENFN